jgi:hypothetical protein
MSVIECYGLPIDALINGLASTPRNREMWDCRIVIISKESPYKRPYIQSRRLSVTSHFEKRAVPEKSVDRGPMFPTMRPNNSCGSIVPEGGMLILNQKFAKSHWPLHSVALRRFCRSYLILVRIADRGDTIRQH